MTTPCWRSSCGCAEQLSEEPLSTVLCSLRLPSAKQLDDGSHLALFSQNTCLSHSQLYPCQLCLPLAEQKLTLGPLLQYDPEATGHVRYHTVMKALLDSDSYAQYAAGLSSA